VGRLAQQPRQAAVDALVVDRVPELVEHGAHPVLVGAHVAQHPNVVGAVHRDAERVLALAGLLVQVGARQQIADLEAHRLVEAPRQRFEVLAREPGVEVDRRRRGLLEERIGVVPGTQLGRRDAEPAPEPRVEVALVGLIERARAALDLVEPREQLALVELVLELQGQGVVIAEAEPPRGLVAQSDQLAQPALDLGADLLGGLPGAAPQRDVAGVAQDLADPVVADPLTVERGAEGVEAALDLLLEPHDALDVLGRELVGAAGQVEQHPLALEPRVGERAATLQAFEQRERLRAREHRADLRLEPRTLALGRGITGDVGVPDREVEAQGERLDLGDHPLDQPGDGALALLVGGLGGRHGSAQSIRRAPAAKPMSRARRAAGLSVRGAA